MAKPHINIVFIGHVDHGKSTTVGRLLYDSGSLSEQDLKKLKEEAAKVGKETFEFAFAMDQLKEERERGVTIDISHKEFETQKYHVTIIDAPGHKDFIKNMITGTSQAQGAVLVCSVKEGIQPQTKEHALLAKALGIDQLVVAVNKMDTANYDRVKFEDLKAQLITMLKQTGYKTESIIFVPISGYYGDNVFKKSDKMDWYKGPTLAEAIDTFTVSPPPIDKPFRLPVQGVYTISGHGTVVVGEVKSGTLKPGEKVVFMPSGKVGEVKKIEMHHKELPEAKPGDNVGINVKNVEKKDISSGEVCGKLDNPPIVAKEFTAQIFVTNHPTAIAKGYAPVFHIQTAHVSCSIVEIIEKKDPKTGQTLQKNPDFIKNGDIAVVRVVPKKPVVVEEYSKLKDFGRFAMRDMGTTVALGIVLSVVPDEQRMQNIGK
ncbi:MAG: translation elongation factor EF-1 subunit alpha [Candidatus Anstonellales archaeon]